MYILRFAKKIIRERELRSVMNEVRLKINTLKWQRKHKDFNEYYANRQWDQAIIAGKNTVAKGPVDQELYRKLANSYIKVNDGEKAKKHMKAALKLRSGLSKKEMIHILETSTFKHCLNVESHFTYLGGGDNLGFIQHLVETVEGTEKYLTKIVPTDYPLDHFAKKEQYFHEVVRSKSSDLKHETPEMVGAIKIKKDKVLLMTFPKLANDGISRENFNALIQINKKISRSLQAEEIKKILKVTDRGKAYPFSSLMHRRSTHLLIFQRIRNKINCLGQREELKQLVARFEKNILTLELYREINPTEDYVFCHGDFNGNNILYNQEEDSYYVIDWSSYGLGLRGQDLAKLFASHRIPFKEITEHYIKLIFEENEKARLDKVLFVYLLFIQWIDRLDLENIDEQITEQIAPAADYIDKLMAKSDNHL